MDNANIDYTILSFPAISIGRVGQENRVKTREINEYAAAVCRQHPARFGFFASLPFLDDTEGNGCGRFNPLKLSRFSRLFC